MAHHARRWIVEKHALDPLRGLVRSIADDHHAGVLRISHADSTAVMEADPGCSAGRVQQRIEQRPIRYSVRTVLHRFGLAIRTGNRSGIQVIAADDNRGFELARLHHFIKRQTRTMTLAKPQPADPRRESLESDSLPRQFEPAMDALILGEKLLDLFVGLIDVVGIS